MGDPSLWVSARRLRELEDRSVRSVLLLALVALAAAAPAGAKAPFSTLRADVAEWSIVPSSGVVRAGQVRIVVRNFGAEAHQVMVVRTRRFAERLPLKKNRAVARPVAVPVLVPAGATRTIAVSLSPGAYLLLDNLPWHYWKGTSVAFAVQGPA